MPASSLSATGGELHASGRHFLLTENDEVPAFGFCSYQPRAARIGTPLLAIREQLLLRMVVGFAMMSRCCDMSDFKKLAVWRKAHGLSLNIHRMAARIRGATYASLRSQLVRAGMSIPAAIVEGRGQKSDREFARYLRISINSSSELEYHLITARDVGVMPRNDYLSLLTQVIEVRRMLYGLLNTLDNS